MKKILSALLILSLNLNVGLAGGSKIGTAPPVSLTAAYAVEMRLGNPLFITSDFAFERVHFYFSAMLEAMEEKQLSPLLAEMLNQLHAALLQAHDETKSSSVSDLLNRNLDYVHVARCLLGEVESPEQGKVSEELKLIAEANQIAVSPVMGYSDDYTQYLPRGHYEKSEELQRYFRTITWLSRAAFSVEVNPAAGIDEALAQQLTAQAVLMLAIGSRQAAIMQAQAKFENVLTAWIGQSDDLTFPEINMMLTKLASSNTNEQFEDSVSSEKIKTIRDFLIANARRPRILGTLASEGSKTSPLSIRVIGQRFSPDSYVFHALTFDRVLDYTFSTKSQMRTASASTKISSAPAKVFTLSTTAQGRKVRGVPRSLDLMATLGSKYAVRELARTTDDQYQRYTEQRRKLQTEIPDLLKNTESFSANYLLAVQAALQEDNFGGVNSALGGWIMLRHDLLAYAKQSYTAIPKGGYHPPSTIGKKSPIYVAPAAPVFLQLKRAVELLLRVMEPDDRESGMRLAALLQLFADQAGKGAIPEKLASPIYAEITRANASNSSILIADAHTDLISKQVLQVGLGYSQRKTFPVEKGSRATGFVFQCYEFRQSMQNRLTDQKWQDEMKRNQPLYRQFVIGTQSGAQIN